VVMRVDEAGQHDMAGCVEHGVMRRLGSRRHCFRDPSMLNYNAAAGFAGENGKGIGNPQSHGCHISGLFAGILGLIATDKQGKPAWEETGIMAKKDRQVMQQLNHAARLARTVLATRLLEENLYAGQDQLMLALARLDGQTPSALAAEVGVRPPTITKTISRLQAQGFLTKTDSVQDARQAHIFLTEAGRSAIAGIEKAVRKTEKLALDGFDKKERKLLVRYLHRLGDNLAPAGSKKHAVEDELDLDDEAGDSKD
jgi:DNA-binding MarR family transcriptional regulator